jgi:hypothetical protein
MNNINLNNILDLLEKKENNRVDRISENKYISNDFYILLEQTFNKNIDDVFDMIALRNAINNYCVHLDNNILKQII